LIDVGVSRKMPVAPAVEGAGQDDPAFPAKAEFNRLKRSFVCRLVRNGGSAGNQ
jgi:hypothetical protein